MKKLYIFLALMALVSPVFGVWLANLVGYHEPLDVAAEKINELANETLHTVILQDVSDQMNWTPLKDYTVPGLPDWLGYIISAYIGLAVFIALWLVARRVKKTR